jgi:hypothetical protein
VAVHNDENKNLFQHETTFMYFDSFMPEANTSSFCLAAELARRVFYLTQGDTRPMNELIYLIAGLSFFTLASLSFADNPSGADQYLSLLNNTLTTSRQQMPAITASAEKAAKLILAGGTIWAGGRQEDFASEATGRAGGLMSLKTLDEKSVKKNDVVLYAVSDSLNDDDLKKIEKWSSEGVEVVVFTARGKKTIPQVSAIYVNEPSSQIALPVTVAKDHKILPVDTLINIVNLWTWTGEFVAACTRQGKMPVLYQSYGVPGGIDRAKKYQNKVFHDDLSIKAIKPGVLGSAYLDTIETALKTIRKNDLPRIALAAKWWQEVGEDKSHLIAMGHMFPAHFKDSRAPQPCSMEPGTQAQKIKEEFGRCQFVLFVGYQYPPQLIASQMADSDFKLVYCTVQSASPAETNDKMIYINPHWPLADGCVHVPGYDVAILPASGVIDAAIYWSILAQRYKI